MKKPSEWTIRHYAGITAGILLLILIIQNRHPVTLRFFWGQFELSMLLFLPLVFAGGMVAGYAIRRKKNKPRNEEEEEKKPVAKETAIK